MPASGAAPPEHPTSARVVGLLESGWTARRIALELGIGVRTVETHVAHVYRKLAVRTREELRGALTR